VKKLAAQNQAFGEETILFREIAGRRDKRVNAWVGVLLTFILAIPVSYSWSHDVMSALGFSMMLVVPAALIALRYATTPADSVRITPGYVVIVRLGHVEVISWGSVERASLRADGGITFWLGNLIGSYVCWRTISSDLSNPEIIDFVRAMSKSHGFAVREFDA
jgi:hypothetical protein